MGGARKDGPVEQALARMRQTVADRIMRWRGHPPELAGVREPRRPRPTLSAAAIALAEPRSACAGSA
jgi:hypothetical protein